MNFKRCSVCYGRIAKASTATAHPKCLLPRVPGWVPRYTPSEIRGGIPKMSAMKLVKVAGQDTSSEGSKT